MEALKDMLYSKDTQWVLFFNIRLKCRFFDRMMPVLTYLGSAIVTVTICLLLIFLGDERVRRIGIEALLSLTFSHLIVEVLKRSFCRPRPKDEMNFLHTYHVPIDLYSFPSGHATAVFAIAVTLSLSSGLLMLMCIPAALVVCASRLYLGVHYPSDVIAGAVIALLTSVLLHCIFF